MTQNDPSKSTEDEMKALEVENATYVEVENTSFDSQTVQEEQSHKPVKTGLLWFFTLINLILVIVVIGAAYWAWTNWQETVSGENTALQEQQSIIAAQTTRIQRLSDNLSIQESAFEQKLNALTNQIAMAREQAESNRKNLADVSGRRPSDWLLAEADYLVRMAGRKLWLENDVKTAVAMLQAADSRLQDLADPSLLPVRQFIASDIQTLQQINPVSLTSVALSISGLIPQVNNLPLALPEATSDLPKPEEVEGWERIKAYILSNFRYQTNSQPIRPLLTEQQQWLAKEQLRYALLQSKSAVLQGSDTLFKQSLQRALGLLVEHYDLESNDVTLFVDALQNLESMTIEKDYPSQLDSARPLQDMLEERMRNSVGNGQFEL